MPTTIDWTGLIDKGAVVALAAFAIKVLVAVYDRWLREKDADRATLIEVVRENTKAFAEQGQALRQLTEAICNREKPAPRRKAGSSE